MLLSLIKSGLFVLLFAVSIAAQVDASNDGFRRERPIDPPKGFKEMVAKQRLEKEKKDHEEMVNRAEKALAISEQLETSFETNNELSKADMRKLEELEEIVDKIRKELGADDDDEGQGSGEAVKEESPSTPRDAFKFLQSNAVKLVDELKKTTRHTISVVAIQSTNNVLKLVRFLRLRN